jgi:hypothetical protein
MHNEELHNLFSPPNAIRMIKSRRVRWVGHVARMAEKISKKLWLESLRERAHSIDLGIDGMIILKRFLGK